MQKPWGRTTLRVGGRDTVSEEEKKSEGLRSSTPPQEIPKQPPGKCCQVPGGPDQEDYVSLLEH